METLPEVGRLTGPEKLQLAVELWENLQANPDEIPMSAAWIDELDRRMEEHRRNPGNVTSWAAIQSRVLGKAEADE